jgi:hypothetical protein
MLNEPLISIGCSDGAVQAMRDILEAEHVMCTVLVHCTNKFAIFVCCLSSFASSFCSLSKDHASKQCTEQHRIDGAIVIQ